jgi:hypothetical protein
MLLLDQPGELSDQRLDPVCTIGIMLPVTALLAFSAGWKAFVRLLGKREPLCHNWRNDMLRAGRSLESACNRQ